jgi:hypothetical protein
MFFSLEPSTRIEEDALYSKRPVMVKVMAFISSGSCCVKTALMTRGRRQVIVSTNSLTHLCEKDEASEMLRTMLTGPVRPDPLQIVQNPARIGKSRLLVDAGEDILDDVRAGSMTAQPRG